MVEAMEGGQEQVSTTSWPCAELLERAGTSFAAAFVLLVLVGTAGAGRGNGGEKLELKPL